MPVTGAAFARGSTVRGDGATTTRPRSQCRALMPLYCLPIRAGERGRAPVACFVNVASLPPDAEIAPEWDACIASIQRPAAQARLNKLMKLGFHKPGDVENRLGYHVGRLGG